MATELSTRQIHNKLLIERNCSYVDSEGHRCTETATVTDNSSHIPKYRCIDHLHYHSKNPHGINQEDRNLLTQLGLL
jgi:hypothetical protein